LNGSSSLQSDRIKITYIRGIANGLTHVLRADIGQDLIKRGYVKEER
jgi:hypothetical protein